MTSNNHYQQSYPIMHQGGGPQMQNLMSVGFAQQPDYRFQPQMMANGAMKKNSTQAMHPMMMHSQYQAQMMNPYIANQIPPNRPQSKSLSKSRASLSDRQMNERPGQDQWYPSQLSNVPIMMGGPPLMNNGYGTRPPINRPANPMPQMANFYPQSQQYINGPVGYQQVPLGYNLAHQNVRPPKIQSTIPTLPMINNLQSVNHQALMMQPQLNYNYGGYGGAESIDRPGSTHSRSSRPSSASSQQSANGLNLPVHSKSFRTGAHPSAKEGRRTPVEKRTPLTTNERYMKNSRGSLATLGYETYDIEDWKRQKNRDGNMKLPSGLGHTETNEWKNKVITLNL